MQISFESPHTQRFLGNEWPDIADNSFVNNIVHKGWNIDTYACNLTESSLTFVQPSKAQSGCGNWQNLVSSIREDRKPDYELLGYSEKRAESRPLSNLGDALCG